MNKCICCNKETDNKKYCSRQCFYDNIKGKPAWNSGTKGLMPPSWNKGKPSPRKGCKNLNNSHKECPAWNKGIPCSEQTKIKISKKLSGRVAPNKGMPGLCRNKNGNWKGGYSYAPYCSKFNKKLKKIIRLRDNNTCQLCITPQLTLKQQLSVHHIHYDKENCYPDLISLCNACNTKVNGNRKHYEELFMNKLNDKGLLFWTRSII